MSQGITVSSTTNSDEEVRAAAGLPPEEKPAGETQPQAEAAASNGHKRGGRGFDKRIDKLTAQKYAAEERARELEERLRRYEAPGALESRVFAEVAQRKANGNGAQVETQREVHAENGNVRVTTNEAAAEEEQRQPERKIETPADHTTKALREEYPDWDETFTRAQRENYRIADEAAKVLHALPDNVRSHVSYLLAKNDDLRNELNKLPPAQQAQEIEGMARNMDAIRNGGMEFAQRAKETLTKEERAEIIQAGKRNPLGTTIVVSLVKELNYLPNGPEVMKYLVLNPDACKRFERMNQQAASIELGRISARLENGNGVRAIVSRAPSPISPLRGGGIRPSVDLADPEIDYQSFKKEREKGSQERIRKGYGV